MRISLATGFCCALACACGPAERSTMPIDASADAYHFQWLAAPFSATGTTPAGPIDELKLIRARYLGEWCGYEYEIQIVRSLDIDSAPEGPHLLLLFQFPKDTTSPQTGTFAARAKVEDETGLVAYTEMVTLDAERVDPSGQAEPHIVGRFVSSDPGWSLDFRVDVVSQYSTICPPGI